MKRKFSANIAGKSWWKPFLGLFSANVAALIVFELSWMRFLDKATLAGTMLNIALSLCAAFPLLTLTGFFTFFAYSRTIKTLSLDDSKFGFRGSLYAFAGDYVKGCLLALISLGLYLPALIRKTHAYLLHATEYEGHRVSFRGKTKNLVRALTLGLVVPILAFVGLLFLIGNTVTIKPPRGVSPTVIPLLYAACTVIFAASLGPFLFFFVSWCCDFKVGVNRISIQAKPDKASNFIALQLAISALTLGLYLPIAFMRVWGYLAERAIISDGSSKIGNFGFTGTTLRGCMGIWVNAALCVITLGIWTPWGVASILRYLAQNTFVTIETT